MIGFVLSFLVVTLISSIASNANREIEETPIVRITLHPPHSVGGLPQFGMYERNRTVSLPLSV